MDWLMKWIDWIARDPGNAAWWMGGATIGLMLLLVTVSSILRYRRQNPKSGGKNTDVAELESAPPEEG